MVRPGGILRQESRNRRSSPSEAVEDPQSDAVLRLLRKVGEEQHSDSTLLVDSLKQLAHVIVNEHLARVVNSYLRSRRSRILSYDNFFRALSDFRNKLWSGSSSGLGWRAKSQPEECTIEDFETFDVLIELIGNIAEYDEGSRTYIADNPDWNHPLHILSSLVSCGIPTTMKATTLRTLASFAKSSGSAMLIWQYMGPLIAPLTVTGPKEGLKYEMEEVEVRHREFPVTKAINLLMYCVFDNLTAHTLVPELLQQFQDFTEYVYDAVFLRADERSFSTPQEHLDVLLSCLTLFGRCLRSLNDMSLVFVSAMTSHPGYTLRRRILEGSAFFEKLVSWLIVCTEEHGKSHGDAVREKLEDVVLHILAIFRSVVNRHDEFLRLLLQHDKNAIVRGLDEIITASMNARTTRRDFIFVFLRLLRFRTSRPVIAQYAMEVLEFVTRRVQDQSEWLTIMHFDEGLSKELVANLVDCLEISPKASDEDSPNLESTEGLKLIQQTLRLLLGNLKDCRFPNIAHVALGFPVRNGTIAVMLTKEGTTSSSLNNILQMVETGKSLYVLLPTCTEIALDILDTLCQHQKTGPAVLEFIQLTWPGELTIGRLAQQLPLVELGNLDSYQFLRHQKAILHIVARQLHLLTEQYKVQSAVELISLATDFQRGRETQQANVSLFSSSINETVVVESSPLLLRLLSVADLVIPSLEPVSSLALDVLECCHVEDALNASKIATDDGLVLHDAAEVLLYIREMLHVHEENGMGRSDVVQDMKTICEFIEKEALLVGLVRARRECLQAWSVLASVVAEACPSDAFAFPIVPAFFLNFATFLTLKIINGLPSADVSPIFEALFSAVTALVRFTGPGKVGMSLSDALTMVGYSAECVKMDYKSVIVRTKSNELTDLTGSIVALILRPITTLLERRGYYAVLLLILKFADWNFDDFEDATLSYSQSVQAAANALRLVIWSGLESSVLTLQKSLQADSTMIKGPEEGVIVEILSRLHAIRGHCSSDNINDSSDSDFVAYLLASLPKDNAFLTQCVTTQTDTFGVLTNFETKINILTAWIETPGALTTDPEEISHPLRSAVKAVLQFNVVKVLPVVKDARNTVTSVQRAMMTGTYMTVYGYCSRIFRKIVDFLVAVLRQLRLRPAYRDSMLKIYEYMQTYGVCFSDSLREPSEADESSWEDLARTVELVSLVNHNSFHRSLTDAVSLEISPEILAIELKMARLFHNLKEFVLPASKGNYKDYYKELAKRSRSVSLAYNMVTYLRRLMFECGDVEVNLHVIRPVFSRSQVIGRTELARGTFTITYGDIMEHIKAFCSILLSRVTTLENLRYALTQSGSSVSETDLITVLDSDYLPSRREDKQNLYKLFLKEQERDTCVDLRKLLSIVEVLTMMLVIHLEYAFAQFLEEKSRESTTLPLSMRRALLPALEEKNPSAGLDDYYHFKSNVKEFITQDLVKNLQNVYEKVGSEVNGFLGIFIDRILLVIQEANAQS